MIISYLILYFCCVQCDSCKPQVVIEPLKYYG